MRKLLFCILLLLASNNSFAQTAKELLYNFSTDSSINSGNGAQYAEDSFFIGAGQAETDSGSELTSYISLFDYNLNLVNKRYLHFPGKYNRLDGQKNEIVKISANRYALLGYEIDLHTNARIGEIDQPYLFLFDGHLDSLGYTKNVDTVRSRWDYGMMVDKQKNVIITGLITSKSTYLNAHDSLWYPDSSYVWVAKYDSNVNLIWEHQYWGHGNSDNWGYKIVLGNDSNSYILAGETYDYQTNFFAKLDTAGNVMWRKPLLRPIPASSLDIDIIPLNGGYGFIGSYSDSFYTDRFGNRYAMNSFFYYGKINETGDTVWTRHIRTCGCAMYGTRIVAVDGGDLLLLGTHDDTTSIPTLFRTDSVGNIKWYREYRYKPYALGGNSELVNMSFTSTKQILLSGAVVSNGKTPVYDTAGSISWFVLTDSFGCVIPGCEDGDTVWKKTGVPNISTEVGVAVYPNPFNDKVIIELKNYTGETLYSITDIEGREMHNAILKDNGKNEISTKTLAPGMYFLRIVNNGVLKEVKKIIKE